VFRVSARLLSPAAARRRGAHTWTPRGSILPAERLAKAAPITPIQAPLSPQRKKDKPWCFGSRPSLLFGSMFTAVNVYCLGCGSSTSTPSAMASGVRLRTVLPTSAWHPASRRERAARAVRFGFRGTWLARGGDGSALQLILFPAAVHAGRAPLMPPIPRAALFQPRPRRWG
jgi:hypothetical protein